MNNSVLTIMKKELARFFGDKKVVFSTILLPGLMIFILYSFMGSAITSQYTVEEDYKAGCYIKNLPDDDTLQMMLNENFSFHTVSSDEEIKQAKKKLQQKETDLCVVFPENFMENIAEVFPVTSNALPPEVQIFYNSSETASETAYQTMSGILNEFEGILSNRFDINKSDGVAYDLAKKEDMVGSIFSSMLPMLLLIFLFSGTLAVTPESIAGEKERGTIATLLVTPVKRSHIAI